MYTSCSVLQNSSSLTTWYLPMYNYVGTIYIMQSDKGTTIGYGVWSNITALGSSTTNYTYAYSDAMIVSYNGSGQFPYDGLEFTGVNLNNYTLAITYIGINGPSWGLVSTDPVSPTIVTSSGTKPTILATDSLTYTTIVMYATASLTFSQVATISNNISSNYTYVIDGTPSIGASTTAATGASCTYLNSSTAYSSVTSLSTTIGSPSSHRTTLTINGASVISSQSYSNNFSINNGGAGGGYITYGFYTYGGGGGGAGGPTGIGGTGESGYTSNGVGYGGDGGANNGMGGSGGKGSKATQPAYQSGCGGGGALVSNTGGANGATVITLVGVWAII